MELGFESDSPFLVTFDLVEVDFRIDAARKLAKVISIKDFAASNCMLLILFWIVDILLGNNSISFRIGNFSGTLSQFFLIFIVDDEGLLSIFDW